MLSLWSVYLLSISQVQQHGLPKILKEIIMVTLRNKNFSLWQASGTKFYKHVLLGPVHHWICHFIIVHCMLACCILLLVKHTCALKHCISLLLLIKKQFYFKLLCMIVFTCRFCSITNLFCLMSAMDEQEAENSKKCGKRQNSDSHRQLNFQKN